jgi:hypothetical protein
MKTRQFNTTKKKMKPAQKNQSQGDFFEAQVQRKCEKCEDKEEEKVQKKSSEQTTSKSKNFFGHYMNQIDSKGSGISKSNRTFFESRLNDNFGNVKIHRDSEAANAAKEIGAKAFTYQNHIVINNSYFNEDTVEGKKLLAHELKHVQQQKNGRHKIQMMPETEGKEKEAVGTTPEKEEAAGAAPVQEEGVLASAGKEGVAMEKEAEQEEVKMMVPERLPNFQTFGQQSIKKVKGTTVSFEGETTATFNGGVGTALNLARTPAETCEGCAEGDCFHYTGQFQINYSVSTSVSLPNTPEGLTPCQQERVRNAIDNVLAPHEQDHVAAFNQYNGTVTLPMDYTGCSAGIQEYAQQLHNADAAAREARVNAASAALDPFHVSVDLDCVDAAPPSAPEGEGGSEE